MAVVPGRKALRLALVLTILVVVLLLGLVTSTVSAATFGDTYPVWGYNLGYVLIGLAILLILGAYALKMFKSIQKPMYILMEKN